MRWLAVLCLFASTAHADDLTEGQELARTGQFSAAIAKFKAAHAAAPELAEPECLTALGYRRLERWGQANLFLARCRALANAPDYVDKLGAEIDAGTAKAGLVPVSFALPRDARISVASWAADEAFGPQTIFLEPGTQHVTITSPGLPARELALSLVTGTPQTVGEERTPKPEEAPLPHPVLVRAAPDRHLAKVMAGVAGGLLAVSVVVHVLAAKTRSDTQASPTAFDDNIDTFKTERAVALAGYGLTAIAAGIDAWLWARGDGEVAGGRVGLANTGAGLAWSRAW